eukprot:937032-Pyramimonas_sp.AAC.1
MQSFGVVLCCLLKPAILCWTSSAAYPNSASPPPDVAAESKLQEIAVCLRKWSPHAVESTQRIDWNCSR